MGHLSQLAKPGCCDALLREGLIYCLIISTIHPRCCPLRQGKLFFLAGLLNHESMKCSSHPGMEYKIVVNLGSENDILMFTNF
jgi:hypothetical protein